MSAIDIKQLTEGHLNGTRVWVCHFNQPDLLKKPLRNVPPTEMLVVSNGNLPENKKIYYSTCHLRPLSKKGLPTSRIVPIFDNTGFRGYTGTPLHVFDNKEECIKQWHRDLDVVRAKIDHEIEVAAKVWEDRLASHRELYVDE
ncbi:MAG: hypothetical protein GY833_12630 [Aestuariibacter sp.]|nr:hypothetical protein [Aestuariibacter sp.]